MTPQACLDNEWNGREKRAEEATWPCTPFPRHLTWGLHLGPFGYTQGLPFPPCPTSPVTVGDGGHVRAR